MGYYKRLDSEQQAEVDRTVRWWRDNHENIPTYVMHRILADKKLLDDLMDAWDYEIFKTPSRKRPAKSDWSMTHKQAKTFIGTMFTLSAVTLTLVIVLVSL